MAYGKAGRPRQKGWLSMIEASKRLGISYWSMRQALLNRTAFSPDEVFQVSESRYLVSAAAVEKKLKAVG